ncbi:hypothetical protein ERO13_A09G208375v2 [Gossypium hirsutum]|uniref:Cystatin domain-containing protein n=4 Tax=Gossypium TaxID=3633 RepID=A0A2P5XDQ0_GOSBA|nr:hypothetical protein ERO13_A09G208375v2 [Gossypium hirsutum]PPS01475.1 hypothetical protein GOBAR_AA19194 [Gossypium barbadense]TYH03735.1 hypothetical protein ES288_A09G243100v1 [Gossypium darwinii]TYI11899.1 hypothetical protein ES332_A09G238600v1 [Gossypium tomentosum]TYJ19891.1 hypothetical protein E1A91_A09G222700v1 [Gossypium mustelinum]
MVKNNLKNLALSFLAITLLLIVFTPVNGCRNIMGGRTPVEDVENDKAMQALGRFAVEEHNKNQENDGDTSDQIKFSQVVGAEKQIVSGIKYFLTVEGIENGKSRMFDSIVLIKPWSKSEDKQLISFSPIQ